MIRLVYVTSWENVRGYCIRHGYFYSGTCRQYVYMAEYIKHTVNYGLADMYIIAGLIKTNTDRLHNTRITDLIAEMVNESVFEVRL